MYSRYTHHVVILTVVYCSPRVLFLHNWRLLCQRHVLQPLLVWHHFGLWYHMDSRRQCVIRGRDERH